MAETLEESLRSILKQIDDRFEVLVVDDGSTDGSIDILKELNDEYDSLRLIFGNNNNLGEARNFSFKNSKGEYILESLDTDDMYFDNVILDFVEIFHQIENQVNFDFYLSGDGINMAKRSLLLKVPYRSLGYGEDKDFWRRLIARDAYIGIKHGAVFETIGYEPNILDKIRQNIEIKTVDFQVGITFLSWINWSMAERSFPELVLDLIAFPIAYLKSRQKKSYEAPKPKEKFKKKKTAELEVSKRKKTLSEIEDHYKIKINRNKLSEKGKRIFDR